MQTQTTLVFKSTRSGTSARGVWTLTIFQGGDNREYTTLDPALASLVQANNGATFDVEYEERPAKPGKEQYGPTFGLLGASAVAGTTPATPPAAPTSGGKAEFRSPQQIIRTSAIEAAVSAFQGLGLNPVEDVVGLLEFATVAEAYITEGIEEE